MTARALSKRRRKVIREALADAIRHRQPTGLCPECDQRDQDRTAEYIKVAAELGLKIPNWRPADDPR